jgi:phage terminase Nu1 subunit (DNA packaging protein)
MELSADELGALVGFSGGRRIRQIDKDLPEKEKLLQKGEGGKYDLAFFVQQWAAYQVKQNGGKKDLDLGDIEAQHEQLKMEITQIKLDQMRGDICSTSEVYRLWAEVARTVTGKLMSIPSTLAPRITGMENTELVEAALDKEIRDCLAAVSRTPMPKDVMQIGFESLMDKHDDDVPAPGEDESK